MTLSPNVRHARSPSPLAPVTEKTLTRPALPRLSRHIAQVDRRGQEAKLLQLSPQHFFKGAASARRARQPGSESRGMGTANHGEDERQGGPPQTTGSEPGGPP